MGYLYLMMVIAPFVGGGSKSLSAKQGVIISSAVFPAVLTLMWNKQIIYAVCLSPVLGLACSLIGTSNCYTSTAEDQPTNSSLKLGL